MDIKMIFAFFFMLVVVLVVVILFIRWAAFSNTESAINQLTEQVAKTNARQTELNQKLKEADEELAKRKAEAQDLANKMRQNAEEESKAEREKMILKARGEAEEIIAKAQSTKDKIRKEIEKEMDLRTVQCSMDILNNILNEKVKGQLATQLVDDFIDSLKEIDGSKIGTEVVKADILTLQPLDEQRKSKLGQILKEKLGRNITVNTLSDPHIGGGAILKFGSMAIDGSLKNLIRVKATAINEEVEARAV